MVIERKATVKLFFYFLIMVMGLAGCVIKETKEIIEYRDAATNANEPQRDKNPRSSNERPTNEESQSDAPMASPDATTQKDSLTKDGSAFDSAAENRDSAMNNAESHDAATDTTDAARDSQRMFGKADSWMNPNRQNLDAGAVDGQRPKQNDDGAMMTTADAANQRPIEVRTEQHRGIAADLDANVASADVQATQSRDAMTPSNDSRVDNAQPPDVERGADVAVAISAAHMPDAALDAAPDAYTSRPQDASLEQELASPPDASEPDAHGHNSQPDATQDAQPELSENVFVTAEQGQLVRYNGDGRFIAVQKPPWSRQAIAWTKLATEDELYTMLVYPRWWRETERAWMSRAEVGDSFPPVSQTLIADDKPAWLYESNDFGMLPDRHAFIWSGRFVYYLKWQDGLPDDGEEAMRAMQETGWWIDPFPDTFRDIIERLEVR